MKTPIRKFKVGLLLLSLTAFAAASSLTPSVHAQPAPLPPGAPDPGSVLASSPLATALNQIQNIDTNATIFARDTMELRLGAVSQGVTGTSFNSSLALDYYFHPNFGVGAEILNGNIGGGVQSINATLSLRKPLGNFCIAGFMGGGRNLEDGAFQGLAGVRVSYSVKPSSRMFTYVESALVVNKSTVNKPTTRFALGLGYAF